MNLFRYASIVIKDELRAIRDQFRESKVLLIAFLVCLGGILIYLEPFHDRHIYFGSSYEGGDWYKAAIKSSEFLKKKGLDSEVVVTEGAVDNVNRLIDPNNPINATFTYGMALNEAQRNQIVSLGSVSYDPVWIFYRKDRIPHLESPRDLANYRVSMGPHGSGSYEIGKILMDVYGIQVEGNDHFISDEFEVSHQRFMDGKTDALIMVATVLDPIVQDILRTPAVELYSFSNADAFDKRFNSFEAVRLPAGSVSIYPQIPARDVSLVATTTSVVVKKDMHPDLQLAFLMTMKQINRSAQNLFFAKRNEFPAYMDPVVPISPVAARFYDYGPPETMRYLPFWIAGFVDRAWLLLLGLVAVFYPLSKLNLHIRKLRFVVHERPFYEELLEIDEMLSMRKLTQEEKDAVWNRLTTINKHAVRHGIPIGEEPHYFDLVNAIYLLRRKLEIN